MQSDTIYNVVQILIILGLGTAWYTEFIRRRKAEADAQVAKDRVRLNEIIQKLETIPADNPIAPVPPHLREYIDTESSDKHELSKLDITSANIVAARDPDIRYVLRSDGAGPGGSDGGSTGDGA